MIYSGDSEDEVITQSNIYFTIRYCDTILEKLPPNINITAAMLYRVKSLSILWPLVKFNFVNSDRGHQTIRILITQSSQSTLNLESMLAVILLIEDNFPTMVLCSNIMYKPFRK